MTGDVFILFVVIGLGLLLGQARLAGVSLGSSAVIFVALAAGHFGYSIAHGIGDLGLILFIYAVGLTAGPSFFRIFKRQGKALALLSAGLIAVSAAAAWLSAWALDVPRDLAAGLFAGALTSTPGLAAVIEGAGAAGTVAVGYGLAYPIGIVAVVLFVQFLPRLARVDLDALDADLKAEDPRDHEIRRVLVEVVNPAVFGVPLTELELIAEDNCQVTRVMRGDHLVPLPPDFALEEGQEVLLVGRGFRLERLVPLLGRESERKDYLLDTDRHRSKVVATSGDLVGKTIGELRLLSRFGVTISRISRHDVEFVPDLSDSIQWGDALQAVGEPQALVAFKTFAGHRDRAFDHTDLVSVTLGIAAGVGIGMLSVGVGGSRISLGLVGGPLLVALVAGHFGRVGTLTASLPRASRLLMMDLGLVLFLAQAGLEAGSGLVPALGDHGLSLVAVATFVAAAPLLVAVPLGRCLLGMDYLRLLGGVCGGMTSTPGLAVLTGKTDSELPITAYAAAYPVALILMTVFGRLLVGLL